MSEDADIMAKAAVAVEKLNVAWVSQKATMDELSGEVKALGSERAETKAKFDKIEATINDLQKVTDDAVLAVKRAHQVVRDENGNTVDLEGKAQQWADVTAAAYNMRPFEMTADGMSAYGDGMKRYLRQGRDGMTPDDIKQMSVGFDAAGGYVVHADMSGQIVKREYETSPMRAYASVQVISSDALEGIFDLDEAGAGWVAELASRPSTTTPALGAWRIPVHEIYAAPLVSQKLLDDASIDIESWLAGKIAERFSRFENAAFVTGTGVGQPRGFLTYSTGTTLPGTIEQIATGVSAGFATAPAGGDALIDMIYATKSVYRANATWFMGRAAVGGVRKLKDSEGSYIWQPGIGAGNPATLLGFPMATFEDMPVIAASSLSIAFGDMRAAYQIVDRLGMRTLRDPYTSKPSVMFYTIKRVGGDVINFEAIKLLRFNT